MHYTILPLSINHLDNATRLRDLIFPGLNKAEHATLEASVYDLSDIKQKLGVEELNYWIAVDKDETVLGIVGLYRESDDLEGRIWLGWYGVDEASRGSGLGSALLDFAIHEARSRGYEELKLYTTIADDYAAARRLYERKGFEHYNSVKKNLLYRLILND